MFPSLLSENVQEEREYDLAILDYLAREKRLLPPSKVELEVASEGDLEMSASAQNGAPDVDLLENTPCVEFLANMYDASLPSEYHPPQMFNGTDEVVEENDELPLFDPRSDEAIDKEAENNAKKDYENDHWLSTTFSRLLVGSIFTEFFYAYFYMMVMRLALYIIATWIKNPHAVHLNTDNLDAEMDGIGYFDTPLLTAICLASAFLSFVVNMPLDILSQTPKKNTQTALKGRWKMKLFGQYEKTRQWWLAFISVVSFILMSLSFSAADYAFVGDYFPSWHLEFLTVPACLFLSLFYIPAYLWQFTNVLEVPQKIKAGYAILKAYFFENPLHNAIFLFNAMLKVSLQFLGRGAGGYFTLFNGLPILGIDALVTRTMLASIGFLVCGFVGACIGVDEALPYPFLISGARLHETYKTYTDEVLGYKHVYAGGFIQSVVNSFSKLPFSSSQRTLIGYCDVLVQLLGIPSLFYFGVKALMLVDGAGSDLWPWLAGGLALVAQVYVVFESIKAKAFHELDALMENYIKLKNVLKDAEAIKVQDIEVGASQDVRAAYTWMDRYIKARRTVKEIKHLLRLIKGDSKEESLVSDIFDVANNEISDLLKIADEAKEEAIRLNPNIFIPTICDDSTLNMDVLIFIREFVGRNIQQALFFYTVLPKDLQQRQEVAVWLIVAASCVYAINRTINFRNEIKDDLSEGRQDLGDYLSIAYRRCSNYFFSTQYDVKVMQPLNPEILLGNAQMLT